MGRNKKFTEEQEQQFYDEYFSEEKPSTATLGKKYGCQATTVGYIIKRKHTLRTSSEVLKGRKAWNKLFLEEQELQICKRYEAGESTYALAKKCGCGQGTICNILKRHEYPLRPLKIALQLENAKQKMREKALQRIQNHLGPFKDTKPELKMEEILNFLHIPYEKQFRIGNHLADFHFLNTNILAEVDGDYFHGNPKIYSKLNETQLKQKERDEKHNKVAKENDFVVLRFWESDILNNTEDIKNFLKRVIK